MITENAYADANGNQNGPTAAASSASRPTARDFRRDAKKILMGLPTRLHEEIKRNPYQAVGVACALGLGAGVVLSSRILRTVLGSALSYAIVEMGRAYLRDGVPSREWKGNAPMNVEGHSA